MSNKSSQNWERGLKANTARIYRVGLQHFCNYLTKTPDTLINEAREDYEKRLAPYDLRHIQYVDSFQVYLKDSSEYSHHSKIAYINGVKNFYRFHKISTADVNDHYIPSIVSEKYLELPILKVDDVRRVVRYFERNKMIQALILTVFSSGQAQDEIFNLRGRHIKDLKNGVAVVKRIRGKTSKNPYIFFISAEALSAIREYKSFIGDDERIFTKKNGDKMDVQYIDQYLSRAESDFKWPKGYIKLHRVRHYWKTELTGHMDYTYLEFVMGHSVPGVGDSYFMGREKQDAILAEYLKNLHLLTVFTDQETLQKENDLLKVKQSSEIDEIRKNYQMLQEQMSVMNEFLTKFGPEGLKMIEGVGKS